MKNLSVPYFSQLDNIYHPTGTCNLTSVAMCLSFHGIRPKNPNRQLEDELFEYVHDNRLSRHSPGDLAKVVRAFGCKDDFTPYGSIESIKQAINNGNPCILHGMFTAHGHIIVGRGYDARGILVNDPYGEYHRSGYDTSASGENLHYSYKLIAETCAYDSEFWVHHVSR